MSTWNASSDSMPTDCHVNVTAEINRLQSDTKMALSPMHSFSFHDDSYLREFYYNATWILVLGA